MILQLCFCSYGVFQAGWLELQKLRMRGFEITSADWKIFFDEIDKWEDLEDGFPDAAKSRHPAMKAIRDVGYEGRSIIFSKENARGSESSEYAKLLEYVAVRDGERMKLFIVTNIASRKDLARLKYLEVNPPSVLHTGCK